MGRRWNGDRLLVVVGLVLVTGAIAVLVWLSRLPPAERNDAMGYWGFVLALVGAVATLWGWLRRVRRPGEPRPVEVLATWLAEAVYGQWRKAANERWLVTPAPIPIRWSLSDLDVTGPVEAAVGPPDQPPAFPPLPGHTTVNEEELRAGGGRRELHQLFAGLASGRIVVVGAPGAGKSGAAILLLLDTLAHRDSLDETTRARVPVPVLFTGHGWDPNTTSTQDWLRDQLVATYPLFQRRGGDADAAALVTARDKIALILDGLDEMAEALRSAALKALSDAPFRVVVLSRRPELIQASAWLVGAAAVQLHNIAGHEAADYLQRARTGPVPSGWTELLTHLREHPDSLLTRELSTPLTLTLIRDTYRADDDVGDLLDPARYGTAGHIERHLIARVLPAAYTPRPGRPPPRYSEAQARQALTFFAQRMNQDHTRDLAWWHIPRWASTMPRIFTTGLKYGLKYGLVYGLLYGLAFGLALGLVLGLVFELTIELVMVTIVVGLISGLGFGLSIGPMLSGIAGAFAGKFVTGRLTRRFNKMIVEPRRIRIATNWSALASRQAIGQGLAGALTGGLIFGWFQGGLVSGVVGAVVSGLVGGLAYGLTQNDTGEGRPLSPREIWRNDRAAGLLIGLLFGLALGLLYGLRNGLIELVFGLVTGLLLGLFSIPKTASTTQAWRALKISSYVPAVRLMTFLEDARDRGVLRTVGSVYQFRHATLQDQLADQTTRDSTVSRVS